MMGVQLSVAWLPGSNRDGLRWWKQDIDLGA